MLFCDFMTAIRKEDSRIREGFIAAAYHSWHLLFARLGMLNFFGARDISRRRLAVKLMLQSHERACNLLLRAADSVGLDGGTLWKAGVLMRELSRKNPPPTFVDLVTGNEPAGGIALLELQDYEQHVLVDGDSEIRRLIAKMIRMQSGRYGNVPQFGEPVVPQEIVKPTATKKRSTERGEAQIKLVAALTLHHKYADGGCLNLEPVGNNELARDADVSRATASRFFTEEFNGHTKYRALCGDVKNLTTALKLLNGEFSPRDVFGSNPPGKE